MTDQSITVCPACGAANGAGSRFCGACGGRLDDAVALYADPSEPSLTPPPAPIAVLPPSGATPTPTPIPVAAGVGPSTAVPAAPAVAVAPAGSGRGLRYALIGVGALIVVLVAVLATVLVARKDPSETAQPTAAAPGAAADTTAPAKPRPKAVILQGPPGAVVDGQPMPFTVVASPTDAVTATVLRIDDQDVVRSNGFAAQLVWPTAAINPFKFTRTATVELTLEGGDTLVSQPIDVTVAKKTLGNPVDQAVYDTLKKFGDSWAAGYAGAAAVAPNSVGRQDPSGYANIREYIVMPVRVLGSTGTGTTVRTGVLVHEEGAAPGNAKGLPAGYAGKYTRQYCMTIDVFPGQGQVDTDNHGAATLLGDTVDWVDAAAAEPTLMSSC